MDAGTLYSTGITLVFVGALVMLVAIVLLFFSRRENRTEVKGGGAIIIGPIPIVFGMDKKSLKTVLILSIALTALLIIATIMLYLTSK
jgi:uncharacterized protein (TIGR00304 family)